MVDDKLLQTIVLQFPNRLYHVEGLYAIPLEVPLSAETVIAVAGEAGANVATLLSGNSLNITLVDGAVMVNDAIVAAADVYAGNGVVHVIDGVLLPPME